MTTPHTATPWVVMNKLPVSQSDHGYRKVCEVTRNGKTQVIYAIAANMIVDGKGFVWGGDDANFIVRACNAHDDLVGALRELKEACRSNPAMQGMQYDQLSIKVNAALAKAGV